MSNIEKHVQQIVAATRLRALVEIPRMTVEQIKKEIEKLKKELEIK